MIRVADRSFRHKWFPVVRCQEIGLRHIHRSQLLNQEIAIWRDDEGRINAWENRCAHRGIRLSIGTNTGTEIKCRYHGWRYASQSGQCSLIPAHPEMKPSSYYCVNVFECIEKYGYVWVKLDTEGASEPEMPLSDGEPFLTLRSAYVSASVTDVRDWLTTEYDPEFKASNPDLESPLTGIKQHHSCLLEAITSNENDNQSITMFIYLHPLTDEATVIHPLVNVDIPHGKRLETLRHYNRLFRTIRNGIESDHVC